MWLPIFPTYVQMVIATAMVAVVAMATAMVAMATATAAMAKMSTAMATAMVAVGNGDSNGGGNNGTAIN